MPATSVAAVILGDFFHTKFRNFSFTSVAVSKPTNKFHK